MLGPLYHRSICTRVNFDESLPKLWSWLQSYLKPRNTVLRIQILLIQARVLAAEGGTKRWYAWLATFPFIALTELFRSNIAKAQNKPDRRTYKSDKEVIGICPNNHWNPSGHRNLPKKEKKNLVRKINRFVQWLTTYLLFHS